MTTSAVDDPTLTQKASRDVRGFWRILLAVIAPVPMLANGVYYILNPTNGGAPFEENVAAATAQPDRIALLEWIQVPFVTLLIPAAFAVVWVTRRAAPRLTTAGALITLAGFCAGFGNLPGTVSVARATVANGLDVPTVSKLSTALEENPITQFAGLFFILGVTFGLLLLGLALWRSRVAPAWMGIALALGGFTHPFLRDHVIAGIGLLVAAVGFAGASYALLRMRNDDFDLPADN